MEHLQDFLLAVPVLLFSMVAHEYAHGYAAFRQGDPTAQQLGRLTWNPLKHIDPFLTVIVPLVTWFGSGQTFIFGGAKPIPVVPANFRHLRRGDIIVSLAGVVTNLALAVLCTLLVVVLGLVGRLAPAPVSDSLAILQQMLLMGTTINLVLFAFNLIPIPPLDGSRVVMHLLPPRFALAYVRFGSVGMLLLMVLLWSGSGVLDWWMAPVSAARLAALRAVHTFVIPSPWTT